MKSFQKRSVIEASAEDLFAWYTRPGALERLRPPWQAVRVLERVGAVEEGGRVAMEFRIGPRWIRWVVEHVDFEPGRQFRDIQVEGPFKSWSQTHRFIPVSPSASELEDVLEYELPLGVVTERLVGPSVETQIDQVFDYCHRIVREDLIRHRRVQEHGPQRIAISGASGLVGSNLAAFLSAGGHRVERLVRRKTREPGEIAWDLERGELDAAALEGVDAVVHLSGANVGEGRWTDERKKTLAESRIGTTRVLCEHLARLKTPPRVLISASAVGYYGDREDVWVDESGDVGEGFLAELCQEWEAAAEPARQRGIRVVHPRIGIVLTGRGGAMPRLLGLFRWGLGGVLGSGRQYMSWIGLEDLIGALHHLIFAADIEGPVNVVAPEPRTNRELTRILGRMLHRPTFFYVPSLAVRAALGEFGQEGLLEGQRASSRRLERSGFRFLFRDLKSALRFELGMG